MPNEIIKERISILAPSYKSFILGDIPQQITTALAKAHDFDEDEYIVFENGFAMFLLFFIDKAGLINYLISDCRLNRHDAEMLAEALILALPPEIKVMHESTSQLIFNRGTMVDQDDISREIAEAEAALKSIEPVRSNTPSNHVPQNKTYTSTQSAILNEKRGGESGPNSPRWGDN